MQVHTHAIEKGENIKMFANREMESFYEEEEEMVRRVGGRGRGLVQAVLRMRGREQGGPLKI